MIPSTDPGHYRQLLDSIRTKRVRCLVIGLGAVGTETLRNLLAAGFNARGFDRSEKVVDRIRSQDQGLLGSSVSTAEDGIDDAGVVIVAVRVLTDENETNTEPIRSVADTLNRCPRSSRLVLLHSTVPPGTTRQLAAEWLASGADCVNFVGYSPERFQEGNTEWSFARTPRLVSGVSNEAAILARSFLGLVCEEVVDVKTPEVAEISKLVENAYIACNISLHGEINRLAAAHKVSGMAIADAAATKPYGYHPFWPGAGFGGHCLPNDLQMLRNAMAAVHIKSPLLDGAASVSAMVPEFLVDRLTEELGRSLDGEYVVIVGVGFKPGSSDTFCSPAEPVVRELRRSGAVVQYFDSLVTEFHVDGERVERAEFREKNRPGIAVVLIKDPAIKDLMLASFELLLDASRGGVQAGHNCRVVRI